MKNGAMPVISALFIALILIWKQASYEVTRIRTADELFLVFYPCRILLRETRKFQNKKKWWPQKLFVHRLNAFDFFTSINGSRNTLRPKKYSRVQSRRQSCTNRRLAHPRTSFFVYRFWQECPVWLISFYLETKISFTWKKHLHVFYCFLAYN